MLVLASCCGALSQIHCANQVDLAIRVHLWDCSRYPSGACSLHSSTMEGRWEDPGESFLVRFQKGTMSPWMSGPEQAASGIAEARAYCVGKGANSVNS